MTTRKRARHFLVLWIVIAIVFSAMLAVSATEEATEETFIEVKTIQDLYNIRLDLTANYKLMNDIDLTEATAIGGDWDFGGRGWNPIGSNDIYDDLAFSGIFDGNGRSIIGMRIDVATLPSGASSTIYAGLFANVTGEVRNLDMKAVNITNGRDYIGAIAAVNGGTIVNCSVSGSIKTVETYSYRVFIGGITGNNSGTIQACFNEATINATICGYYGGISGINTGIIDKCYNIANIIAEYNKSSTSDMCAGGISGRQYGTATRVSNSYNSGNVYAGQPSTGYNYAGGIVGRNYDTAQIVCCYNVGTSLQKGKTGYAIACNDGDSKDGTIKKSYFLSGVGTQTTGATSLTEAQMKLQSMYVGFDFENVWVQNVDSIYPYPQLQDNIQEARVLKEIAIVAMPDKTTYMKGESLDMTGCEIEISFVNADSEFVIVTNDMVTGFDTKTVGKQTVTVVHKFGTVQLELVVENPPFKEIYTIADLYEIRSDLTANYKLMNDIDLAEATAEGGDWDFNGNGWNPIGSNDIYSNGTFSGEFDGNGKKIIGLRIELKNLPSGVSSTKYLGLFASVSGSIYDLTMEDVSITGGTISGGICASASGATFRNCDVYGIITNTSSKTGGVVGEASNSGLFTSKNYATIKGGEYVGGLAGTIEGTSVVEECFNAGEITADYFIGHKYEHSAVNGFGFFEYYYNYAGGIAATANGSVHISNCYNCEDVTIVSKNDSSSSTTKYYYRKNDGGITYSGGIIKSCYNSGDIDGPAISTSASTDCYYLNGTGESSTGATSLTEEQMRLQAMFKGFDFENVWILNEFANHPYPQLRDNIQDMSESASLVSIIALPAKREYMTGDKLDFLGGMVKVVYVSGREEIIDITDAVVSGFDMDTAGEQTVTVTVAGASDTYTINVTERPVVESIIIESEPNAKTFAVGTAFDFTGAKAKVSYVGGITETVDITPDMTTGGNINHIGKQTITYSFGGKSATFEIEVVGIALDKIVITKLPDKTEYLEGESLDLDGLVITAVMNNGFESTVGTGYTVSGYSSKPGDYTITVNYLGKTVTFEVTVAKRTLLSLTLNALPDKFEYVSGEEFDESGMQVVARYDNGDVIVAEDYTVSGFDDVPGIKTVVISLDGKSISFPVKVIARVITEFKLVSLPTKLEYIEYDSFDKTGLVVEATYNDGKTEEVTDYTVTGFTSRPGTHTITIAYAGFVESFDINVTARVLEDIKVTVPNKVSYYIGEEFDDTGLAVTACYNNGQEITLDKGDYQIRGFDSAAYGAKTIVVSYNGIERSFAVVVQERSVVETGGHMTVGTAIGRLGEEVRIPVIVTKNTGIAGFKHEVAFDADNLSLVSVEMADAFGDGTLVVNDENADSGKLNIVWYDTKDVSGDGTVYTLVFEILETAADGNTDITLSFAENDNGNLSGENVVFTPADGYIEVRSYWLGDLNGDRFYRVTDLLYLAQYVAGIEKTLTDKQKLSADVNEDTIIDIHDVIMLQQWVLDAGVPSVQTFALFANNRTSDDATKILLGEIKGKVGQEVVVPVTVENNVGISAFMFEVAYDTDDLTFVSAELGGALNKGVLITQVDEENQRLIVLWYSTEGDAKADGEMLPLTFKINDSASGTYELSVRYLAEDIINETREAILCSIESGRILVGSVLTGNLTSLLVDGDNDVTLVLSNGTEIVDELSISNNAYEFDSVAPGEYTLTVEKKNHATRTYTITVGDDDVSLDVKLNLIGDIDGNGVINISDYAKAKLHAQGKNKLEGYAFDCADVTGDDKVNITDYARLKQHAQGKISIWE